MTNFGVGSWPARRARMRPEAVAFRQDDRCLSYGELAERVSRLAGGLAGLGVCAGDRVAYLGPNDIATFETFFAVGSLGAIFAPLNTRLSGAEIGYMLSDCQPKVLVVGSEMADLVAAVDPESRGVIVVPLHGASSVDNMARAAVWAPEVEVGLGDDALLLYTSGTTGRPKGAVLTHGNVLFNTINQLAQVDVMGSDVVLCTAPLFHVTGLGQVSLPTLFKGGTVVVAAKFDPEWMLRTISEQRISGFSAVPTMLQMLCDQPSFASTDLASLRYVVYGGSPVLERVARAWLERGVDILQGYGMTEAAPGVFLALPDGASARPVSAGVSHLLTDVALLAPDGTISPPPGTGELLVRGPNVFRGYWNRPEDTAASFREGWFRTGDLVRIDADGWSYIVDRVKDMIISGGENVYPAEVEAAIATLPEVAECAVVGVPDQRWGEVGLAFIVVCPGQVLHPDRLRDQLEGRLAHYKIPKHIRFVEVLPRTATGKIRRPELRAMAQSEVEEH
jgi:fatty-acyl-CoA synthase